MDPKIEQEINELKQKMEETHEALLVKFDKVNELLKTK
jgi:hypothetical protein